MEKILNITNGDSAVRVMKAAQMSGDILPWRDVLHDGPVPAGLSLRELSEVRAQFIIDQGWGDPDAIRNDFATRDKQLESCDEYDKVTLWFEHDLYDQLQILQVLDWFADHPPKKARLSIICTEQYLGPSSPEQLKELVKFEEDITEHHLVVAKTAWSAFREPAPELLLKLLHDDLSILPFLEGAIIRLLEEYPNCENGLSRTAQKALELVTNGEKRPGRLFGAYQETEQRRFMGDSSFWGILHELLNSHPPLIELPPGKQLTLPTSPDQELTITTAGREVLANRRNWLDMCSIDRWIGGVHLTPVNVWCWDAASQTLKRIPHSA
ncbi:MAG: DUF1835 domain-containing protein [Gammaproteobacteria bacterium]